MKLTEFIFKYDDDLENKISIATQTKYGAVQLLRNLVRDPEKWFLQEIRESRDCWVSITTIENDWRAMQPKSSLKNQEVRK